MTPRVLFVLVAAALVLAGQVAGPWSAPLAVAALAACRVGARCKSDPALERTPR